MAQRIPHSRPALPGHAAEPVDHRILLRHAHEARETGRVVEARALYERVLAERPDDLYARIGLMRCHFYLEDWAKAWPALDVRFRFMDQPPKVTVRGADGSIVEKPRWVGGPAPRSLLVLDEQGMGDTLQFMRFLPRLVAQGTEVTFVTHRRLFRLIETMGCKMTLRPMDVAGSVAGIEAWSPLLNLPGAMNLASADLEMPAPYISADPERVARWRAWLGTTGFRVGIAWQGNPKAPVDAGRSAGLAAFAPLAVLDGVRLISLQHGVGSEQLDAVPFGSRISVPGPGFDEGPDAFLDTAALIESLDLVVTVDTAVAHVAGALGKPVIVALQARNADWRWIPGARHSRWYPSATYIAQQTPGDWWSAFTAIGAEVQQRMMRAKAGGVLPMTPVSVGELLDKLSILAIKRERIADAAKRANVETEYQALHEVCLAHGLVAASTDDLRAALDDVNGRLWCIEDEIREHEMRSDFGPGFISLARAVYHTNDRRAAIKAELNRTFGSALREEKSYAALPPACPTSPLRT